MCRGALLVSAVGLSEEGALTMSAEDGWGGAGSLEKSFLETLCQEGLRRGEEVVFVDEMRVGLLGQSRRVELRYDWAYLVLGVDPIRKRLIWAWLERVRGVELTEVVRPWKAQGVVGLVWDNAIGEVDVSAALFA